MKALKEYSNVGVVFVSPIIGMPPSLVSAFEPLTARGIAFEWVDIFQGQRSRRSICTVLGLTLLPGSRNRRIRFANDFDESLLFKSLQDRIEALKNKGRSKIILGGMSGGFIFVSRMVQTPLDLELQASVMPDTDSIVGLFGISPLVFYPAGVTRLGADLELIPPRVPVTLTWGDGDQIVPASTIEECKRVALERPHVKCRVIHGREVGAKQGDVKHQFFGGRDFIGPFKNIYWNDQAQRLALESLLDFIDQTVK